MPSKRTPIDIRIGIDIGGTFTDFVLYIPQSKTIVTHKLPSTPQEPAKAVQLGLLNLLDKFIYNRFFII